MEGEVTVRRHKLLWWEAVELYRVLKRVREKEKPEAMEELFAALHEGIGKTWEKGNQFRAKAKMAPAPDPRTGE